MSSGVFSVRLVVLVAYLMAAMLPVFYANGGLPQPSDQHAQMMAAAGHTMPMAGSGLMESSGPGDGGAPMLLCQQHCVLAAATLPGQVAAVHSAVGTCDLVGAAERFVASLATPPPGPPPKVSVV